MYARWQQRQDLRDLDDCLLRDIGIPRDQAERVATQEAAMDRLAEMVQYVRQKNIDRFRELLDEPTDPLRRQQLQQQLAELEAAQQ